MCLRMVTSGRSVGFAALNLVLVVCATVWLQLDSASALHTQNVLHSNHRIQLAPTATRLHLRGGGPEAKAAPAVVTTADPSKYPGVTVANIAKFNNWDHRECSVENAQEWRDFMTEFLKKPPGDVPKKIHQIWIGPKQPPIVWLDTWRKKYRAEYPTEGWEYKLWTDTEVEQLQMVNRDIYDQERMFQCKADILRLEILWQEGGVYIDADMVWLHKSLEDVLKACKDTGFFCGYEPDTKDKPYSVIGNSFIAATPKHPLVHMLIRYIREVYPHKRPYHGVEWVTGPLAFTKCISHSKMPWTVPPQVWFYPKFHYVPNPDAINLNDFPNSYAFQFGYTCSGLEGWVANSIRRCTLDTFWLDKCPQLKDLAWPLGRMKALPAETPPTQGPIPKVIHQFAFQGAKPDRWISSWASEFCKSNPGWSYKCWTDIKELKGDYFCCNMYSDQHWQMDALALRLLALEVLYKHGGYHVPLSVPWTAYPHAFKALAGAGDATVELSMDPNDDKSCFAEAAVAAGFVDCEGLRIVGSARGAGKCLDKIKALMMMDKGSAEPRFLSYPDAVASYLDFPSWTRFLGADEMYDLCAQPSSDRAMLGWSYDSMVPCFRLADGEREVLRGTDKRCIVITDPEVFHYKAFIDAIPGHISTLDQQHGAWQVMLLALEWQTGEAGLTLYPLSCGVRPANVLYVGAVLNRGWAKILPKLDGAGDLQTALYDSLLSRAHCLQAHVACEKFVHDRKLANIYRAIPAVQHAFRTLAQHEAPFDSDSQERNGNTIKGMRHGQVRFELNVDEERRATYRAFNDDGGINSEARVISGAAGNRVEWMKVFYNHAVVFERHNVMC